MEGLLFVPCKKNKLDKILELDEECFIFDLEDSIREEHKGNALNELKKFLDENDDFKKNIVRVNKGRWNSEVNVLYNCGIRKFMIPKAEIEDEINELSLMYSDIEIFLLVETPKGFLNLEHLIKNNNVYAVAFGAEDFCTSIQMTNKDELLIPIKQKIVIISKAYGKKVYDTITLEINDLEKITQQINFSKSLGFDGKMLIHPNQLYVINRLNEDIDFDKYKIIIDEFDKSSEGVLVYDGKVYEKPHIEYMRRCINENN